MVECVDVLMLLVVLLPLLLLKRNGKLRLIQHNSVLTGDGYFNELTDGHDTTFHDTARMDKPTFGKLVTLLVQKGKLKASKGYCYLQEKYIQICAAQKVLMFIYILCGHSQRDTAHRFQHSLSTTSTIIHDVADSILECEDDFIRKPRGNDITHDRIARDLKFTEFEGCLGALDGSHVPSVVSSALQGRFRNRAVYFFEASNACCNTLPFVWFVAMAPSISTISFPFFLGGSCPNLVDVLPLPLCLDIVDVPEVVAALLLLLLLLLLPPLPISSSPGDPLLSLRRITFCQTW